ncbi:hypothetical protein [Calidithermus timidus]|uniref:hypothetical protein n=1 Tax=Calidithermus timidus TaxID=307124 RepID=UPI0012F67839|nr:hypothetical protein [Calidithermus timidus]
MNESEWGTRHCATGEGSKDRVALEPPASEATEEVPAMAFFAAGASMLELRVIYRALEIWLLEAPSRLQERELGWQMHRALERELERRVRESIWPREAADLPF